MLGKYLRALEKALLVTSPWDALPSADAVGEEERHTLAFTASASAAATPLFSPIPFLVRNGSVEPDGFRLDGGLRGSGGPGDEGGNMEGGGPWDAESEAGRRRDSADLDHDMNADVQADGSGSGTVRPRLGPPMLLFGEDADVPRPLDGVSSAPHHEPFMGRVDELDAGPLLPGTAAAPGGPAPAATQDDPHALHSVSPTTGAGFRDGTGEAGTTIPHGMSERPQPISSTTTLPSSPPAGPTTPAADSPLSPRSHRKFAPLPRTTSMGNLADRFVKAEVLPAAADEASGLHSGAAAHANGSGEAKEVKEENPAQAAETPSNGVEEGVASKQRKLDAVEA